MNFLSIYDAFKSDEGNKDSHELEDTLLFWWIS